MALLEQPLRPPLSPGKFGIEARAGIVNQHGRRSPVGQTSPFRGKGGKARNRRSAACSLCIRKAFRKPLGGTTSVAALGPPGGGGARSRATAIYTPEATTIPQPPLS